MQVQYQSLLIAISHASEDNLKNIVVSQFLL